MSIFQILMGMDVSREDCRGLSSMDVGLLDVDSENNQVEKSLRLSAFWDTLIFQIITIVIMFP